jgi:hypothetical protein
LARGFAGTVARLVGPLLFATRPLRGALLARFFAGALGALLVRFLVAFFFVLLVGVRFVAMAPP